MTKIKMLAAAVAVASVSALASAAPPPDAPPVYAAGPMSPAVNSTNMSAQERAAFALLEGMLQSVEGKIHASGCSPFSLGLSVYSDALTTPVIGNAKLGQSPNSIAMNAVGQAPTFRGQAVDVDQAAAGYINGTSVTGYDSTMTYNSANNMMVGYMDQVNVMSINWVPNQFTGYVIKDFYMGIGTDDTHIVYDWGLQSLSKEGYPVEKYWQRSKTRRSDGGNGQTVFVKDRLVGVTKCRITIALSGLNQYGIFQQSGTLSVSAAAPGDAVPEFAAVPNI
ncbi:MAG: hypothetical protein GY942_14830 [Aestuariibacter sp.]|nr:hypothetical protein [Aestuariibacter sp.]